MVLLVAYLWFPCGVETRDRTKEADRSGGYRYPHESLCPPDQSADLWEVSPADPTGPRFRIEDIYPCVDGGRYPVKRIAGESVEVWADIFREGHDVLAAALLWRPEADAAWRREPMLLDNNDRWHGQFTPPQPGWYLFAIEAWTDQFATWRKEFRLKQDAGQDVTLEAREGQQLLTELMPREAAARVVEAAVQDLRREGRSGGAARRRGRRRDGRKPKRGPT